MKEEFIKNNYFLLNGNAKVQINLISDTLEKLRNSIVSSSTFNEIILHLQNTLSNFQFKKVDKQAFVQKLRIENETRIDKQLNGYFISKVILYLEFYYRMKQKKKLTVTHPCFSCQTQLDWNILNTVTSIKFSSLKENWYQSDMEMESFDSSQILVYLSVTGKLGQIKIQRILKKRFKIIEIFLNSNDIDSFPLFRHFGFTPPCSACNKISYGIKSGKNTKKDSRYVEKPNKVLQHTVQPNFSTDRKISKTIEPLDLQKVRGMLNKKLSYQFTSGKYQFKTLKWILTFDRHYFLNESFGPKYQQSVAELLNLAQKIHFEGFPELQELHHMLKQKS